MTIRTQGAAAVALALALGIAPLADAGAPVLPRCPAGEGNPIVFTGATDAVAGATSAVQVRADLSERIDLDIVTKSGRRVIARSTKRDRVSVGIGGLAAGTYRLRVRAAFTFPVPETSELGLCVRVGGRTLTIRPR